MPHNDLGQDFDPPFAGFIAGRRLNNRPLSFAAFISVS